MATYMVMAALVYLIPFLFAAGVIFFAVVIPALLGPSVKNLTSLPRPEPSARTAMTSRPSFDPGFAGSSGWSTTHLSQPHG